MILVGWILIFGSSGALEMGTISFNRFIVQIIISLILIGIGRLRNEFRMFRTSKRYGGQVRINIKLYDI